VSQTGERSNLIRLRFSIEDANTKIFYATGFTEVSHPTRADCYTIFYSTRSQEWKHIPDGCTPVLASEEDRARYYSEINMHALYDQ
jgi:hypothetical protein